MFNLKKTAETILKKEIDFIKYFCNLLSIHVTHGHVWVKYINLYCIILFGIVFV